MKTHFLTLSAALLLSGTGTTLWGYEIDHSTGLLTRLWITDSDDLEKEPKEPLLNEYAVSIGEGMSHIKLSSPDVRYGACYVVALCPVSGYKTSLTPEGNHYLLKITRQTHQHPMTFGIKKICSAS